MVSGFIIKGCLKYFLALGTPLRIVDSWLDFSNKRDFMNDRCHSVEIMYFRYFFVWPPEPLREAIVGKSIYTCFIVKVSYLPLFVFEVEFLDLVYCRLGYLKHFDFHFTLDFNFWIFTVITYLFAIVRWLDSCLYVIFKFKCPLRKGRLKKERPLKKETFIDILQN